MVERIVDAHCHYGKFPHYNVEANLRDFKRVHKKYNCKFLVTISSDFKTFQNWKKKNNDLVKIIQKNPKIFAGLVLWMNSNYPERSIEFANAIPSKIIKMLKIIPSKPKYGGLPVTHRNNMKILKFSIEKQLPFFIHCSRGNPEHPVQIGNLAKKYPKARLIFGHMGGTIVDQNKRAVALAKKCDNLWFDTSGLVFNILKYTIRNVGYDRILFGSDLPVLIFSGQYYAIKESDISERAKRNILYDNIMKLIK
jgi:predicted TIM-barrel fold metal-dependent hydrolase